MPATMEEKAAKVFMTIIKRLGIILFFLSISFACKNEIDPEVFVDELPLPDPFQLSLNLSLPAYQSLEFENHLILDDYGVNGIIIVYSEEYGYGAFERTCPADPEKECARVSMDASLKFLSCNCKEGFFRLNGMPSNAHSSRKLREYFSSKSGNALYVDETITRRANY